MAKKRKTRSQKLLADTRHFAYHLETSAAQVKLPVEKKLSLSLNFDTPNILKPAVSYSYVFQDLKKTALITFSILTAQIILFFILNKT